MAVAVEGTTSFQYGTPKKLLTLSSRNRLYARRGRRWASQPYVVLWIHLVHDPKRQGCRRDARIQRGKDP